MAVQLRLLVGGASENFVEGASINELTDRLKIKMFHFFCATLKICFRSFLCVGGIHVADEEKKSCPTQDSEPNYRVVQNKWHILISGVRFPGFAVQQLEQRLTFNLNQMISSGQGPNTPILVAVGSLGPFYHVSGQRLLEIMIFPVLIRFEELLQS